MFRFANSKSSASLTSEWDSLAATRYEQIKSGRDVTFNHVLIPTIAEMLKGSLKGSLLDAGCGVGVMTNLLAPDFSDVVGIDPSRVSIEIASKDRKQNTRFRVATIESFVEDKNYKFDAIVANMVLMDTINIDSFLLAAVQFMHSNSVFAFSITHPAFWPSYYGYDQEPWYSYLRELIIEAPFRISNDQKTKLNSTHVHRPCQSYFNALNKAGLYLDQTREPMPTREAMELYSSPWRYPRYLFGRCRLKS